MEESSISGVIRSTVIRKWENAILPGQYPVY